MLQTQFVVNNADLVVNRLKVKNFDARELVEHIINADGERKRIQLQHDNLQAKANEAAKTIGQLFSSGKRDEAEAMKQEVSGFKDEVKTLASDLKQASLDLENLLVQLPNIPNANVPEGNSPEDNAIDYEVKDVLELNDDALPHWELAKKYDLIDFETGTKITGAGFPLYKGKGARLQRALISFFLDRAAIAGYVEVLPPHMVNEASAYGTGNLPDKEGQMYHAEVDDLYLIPTAEVPVTNIHRDEIVQASQLPIKYCAYSPCFRREAGSYGKDVRGLNRLHQFDKVEIVQLTEPSQSYLAQDDMKNHVESLLQALNLPYRVLRLCGGDMSFTSALTFDYEVYSAAQKKWLEVSSVSNFEDFQTNRLKIRHKPKTEDGQKSKTVLLHSLNGSALALPRIVAALLENNQDKDGINIPEVLHPYTHFHRID